MAQNDDAMVWIDLEMSGLNPKENVIIEIATIITNGQLEIVAEGPDLVIQQPPEIFETMDEWNREHHTKSGLWQSVLESQVSLEEAGEQTLEFIKSHARPNKSPLCGNSVWQDRRFLRRWLPKIDDYLHYRLVDVSTIKELANRWYPNSKYNDEKESSHRALDDIKDSIDELRYYRQKFFVTSV